MKYNTIKKGIFLSRPNRFLANVLIEGMPHLVHVKNTGRCKELLLEGVPVYLEDFQDDLRGRKTRFSLVAVEKTIIRKGKQKVILVNMDSQATNKAVGEALKAGMIKLPGLEGGLALIQPEKTFEDSRFDFYVEGTCSADERVGKPQKLGRAYIEVKGCTLEEDGFVKFPDAPTERGVKHVVGLCKAVEQGFLAYAIFVIQMKDVRQFGPNDITHPAFGQALREASKCGVHILAYDCLVTENSMVIGDPVEVRL